MTFLTFLNCITMWCYNYALRLIVTISQIIKIFCWKYMHIWILTGFININKVLDTLNLRIANYNSFFPVVFQLCFEITCIAICFVIIKNELNIKSFKFETSITARLAWPNDFHWVSKSTIMYEKIQLKVCCNFNVYTIP